MGDIVVTAAHVSLSDAPVAYVRSYPAAVAIAIGQAVYITTTGTLGLADANAAGAQQFRGIALDAAAAAGQAVSVLHEGLIEGFSVAALDCDALVCLSDTAGALTDAGNPGTMLVHCGRVVCLNDEARTKILYICINRCGYWT